MFFPRNKLPNNNSQAQCYARCASSGAQNSGMNYNSHSGYVSDDTTSDDRDAKVLYCDKFPIESSQSPFSKFLGLVSAWEYVPVVAPDANAANMFVHTDGLISLQNSALNDPRNPSFELLSNTFKLGHHKTLQAKYRAAFRNFAPLTRHDPNLVHPSGPNFDIRTCGGPGAILFLFGFDQGGVYAVTVCFFNAVKAYWAFHDSFYIVPPSGTPRIAWNYGTLAKRSNTSKFRNLKLMYHGTTNSAEWMINNQTVFEYGNLGFRPPFQQGDVTNFTAGSGSPYTPTFAGTALLHAEAAFLAMAMAGRTQSGIEKGLEGGIFSAGFIFPTAFDFNTLQSPGPLADANFEKVRITEF